MPETLHAREIVVPHVQLHQVSGQNSSLSDRKHFQKMYLFQIKKSRKNIQQLFPIERYDSHPKLEGSSNLLSLFSEIQLRF
jgi:hypothetical protein